VIQPNSLDIRTSLARLIAPSLGLLVFAAMLLRGLVAGNPAQTILTRALLGLAGGVVLGSIAGSIAAHILRDRSIAADDNSSAANAESKTTGDGVAAGA
jgi:hypothetical protein